MAQEQSLTAGHVSMMNDVLISQLPPDQLRSSLRLLLSASHSNAALFTSTLRTRLVHTPLPSLAPNAPKDEASVQDVLREARIRFAAHLVGPALELLRLIPDAVARGELNMNGEGSARVREVVVESQGDVLQAMQALKEGGDRSDETHSSLVKLVQSTLSAHSTSPTPSPFIRSLAQMLDAGRLVFPSDSTFWLPFADHRPALSPKQAIDTRIPTVQLGKTAVPRLWFGLWQLSSPSWGSASAEDVDKAFLELVNNGMMAADMADHYADAELLFASFRSRLPPAASESLFLATKYCQFAAVPSDVEIAKEWALAKVEERATRCGGRVELLQVHWQHLSDERYLTLFQHLQSITQTHPHLLLSYGLCNFPSDAMRRICEHMIATTGAVGIVSNQVQYSLIDTRPRYVMGGVCDEFGVKMVTYGTYCGGFLSNRWLGKAEPNVYVDGLNTSQRKYFDMIRLWGGWPLFQSLLSVLDSIAQKYNVDIANIAARWVLSQPGVGVVIVGTRLGVTSHVDSSIRTFDFDLTAEDMGAIEDVLSKARGKEMLAALGDCGQEYR